jgi:hypothetical protein
MIRRYWLMGVFLGVCLAVPSCASVVLPRGIQGAIIDCVVEAGRFGILDQKTAGEWAVDLDATFYGEHK